VEAFNASFSPRLTALKLIAQDIGVVSHTSSPRLLALRLSQVHSASPSVAVQGHTVAAPSVAGTIVAMGVADATTVPEVASYELDVKPIGQWTVGTDFIAATASTTNPVRLRQNILDFEVSNATQGHTVVAPTQNEQLDQMVIVAAIQGFTADPVDFTQDVQDFVITPATQGHTVAAPAITQPSVSMGVDSPNTMGVEVAAPVIRSLHGLTVVAAQVGIEAIPATLFLIPNVPTPASRIFTPAAESRVMTVTTESRTFAIAA
jgi:hypothetical protein